MLPFYQVTLAFTQAGDVPSKSLAEGFGATAKAQETI